MTGFLSLSYRSGEKYYPAPPLPERGKAPPLIEDNFLHDINPNNPFYFHKPDDARQYDVRYDMSGYVKPDLSERLNDELFTDPYGTYAGNYNGVAYGRGPNGYVGNGGFIRGGGLSYGAGASFGISSGNHYGVPVGYYDRYGGGYVGGYNRGGGYAGIGFGASLSYGHDIPPPPPPEVDLRDIVGHADVFDPSQFNDYTGTPMGEAMHWLEVFAKQSAMLKTPAYVGLPADDKLSKITQGNPTGNVTAFDRNPQNIPVIDIFEQEYGGLSESSVWKNYVQKHIIDTHGGYHDTFTPRIF